LPSLSLSFSTCRLLETLRHRYLMTGKAVLFGFWRCFYAASQILNADKNSCFVLFIRRAS
jgi:hypothetical protein